MLLSNLNRAAGQTIHILKFRTMVRNVEEVLQTYLQENPNLREEWEANRLRNNPALKVVLVAQDKPG